MVSKRMLAATLEAERKRWRARKIPAYRVTVSQVIHLILSHFKLIFLTFFPEN